MFAEWFGINLKRYVALASICTHSSLLRITPRSNYGLNYSQLVFQIETFLSCLVFISSFSYEKIFLLSHLFSPSHIKIHKNLNVFYTIRLSIEILYVTISNSKVPSDPKAASGQRCTANQNKKKTRWSIN